MIQINKERPRGLTTEVLKLEKIYGHKLTGSEILLFEWAYMQGWYDGKDGVKLEELGKIQRK